MTDDVVLRAEGDAWVVIHDSLPRHETYETLGGAHRVATDIASREGVGVDVHHPKNPDLREMGVV